MRGGGRAHAVRCSMGVEQQWNELMHRVVLYDAYLHPWIITEMAYSSHKECPYFLDIGTRFASLLGTALHITGHNSRPNPPRPTARRPPPKKKLPSRRVAAGSAPRPRRLPFRRRVKVQGGVGG